PAGEPLGAGPRRSWRSWALRRPGPPAELAGVDGAPPPGDRGRCDGGRRGSRRPARRPGLETRHALVRLPEERGCVNQREVGQTLREIAEELLRRGIDLLGVEIDVVGQGEKILHGLGRLVEALGASERLHEPERAGQEGALLLLHAGVAVQEGPVAELAPNSLDRVPEPLALRVREPEASGE